MRSLSLSTTATTISSSSDARSKTRSPTTALAETKGSASKGLKRQGYESESEQEESSESEEEDEVIEAFQVKEEKEKSKSGEKGGETLSEAAVSSPSQFNILVFEGQERRAVLMYCTLYLGAQLDHQAPPFTVNLELTPVCLPSIPGARSTIHIYLRLWLRCL